jgi:hypothetical protein
LLCSYAWVFGAGFDGFVKQATGADPWRNLGKVYETAGLPPGAPAFEPTA